MKIETFGLLIDEPPSGYTGFVYLVRELSTVMIYVGKKNFYNQKIKNAESDWRTYRTSNTYLKTAIKSNPEKYEYKILGFAKDDTALKILEAEMILKYNSLDSLIGYNANLILNIRCSIKDLTKRKLTLTEGHYRCLENLSTK